MSNNNIQMDPITNVFSVNNTIAYYYYNKLKPDLLKVMKLKPDLLRVMKLVYVCFGVISAIKKQYLFQERIEAWRLGPVVPELYYPLRNSVDSDTMLITENSCKIHEKYIEEEEIKILIEKICEIYSDMTTTKMINLTHLKDSPWHKIYNGLSGIEIPKDDIISYYDNILS